MHFCTKSEVRDERWRPRGIFHREQRWTPVIGKKKKRTIPDYIKRRFPPDHPIYKQDDQSGAESESDEQDLNKVIQTGGGVDVKYVMVSNTPGFLISIPMYGRIWFSHTLL